MSTFIDIFLFFILYIFSGLIEVEGGKMLPLGCQMVGKRGGDVELLQACLTLEKSLGQREGIETWPPIAPGITKDDGDLW